VTGSPYTFAFKQYGLMCNALDPISGFLFSGQRGSVHFQCLQHPVRNFGMRKIAVTGFFAVLAISGFGQISAAEKLRNETLARMDSLRRTIDSTLNPRTLDGLLAKKFPETSWVDGRWVFYKDQANIQQLVKPRVSAVIPAYTFYTVTLTNYLDSQVKHYRILILFDSVNLRVYQALPFSLNLNSMELLSRIIGKTFPDSTALVDFMLELQSLMNAGSSGGFENMVFQQVKVSFDLTGAGANPKPVLEHIEMFIENNTIRRFRFTNPSIRWRVMVE